MGCALLLACSGAWSPRAVAQSVDSRVSNAELDRLNAKIEAALDETTSLQFLEQPLEDIAVFLEDRHKIEVALDSQALDTAGVTTDTPLTIDVDGISLRSALDLMLHSIECSWCIRDGALLVTTPEEVETELITKVYDAGPLLYFKDKSGQRQRHTEPLIDVITSQIYPTTWTDVGGTGAIEVLGESAIISQTGDVQRELGQFLAGMELALKEYQQGVFRAPIDVGLPTTGMTQAIRQALRDVTTLRYQEQPLGDVVAELKDRHKIEIQLDTAALDAAGVTSDTPVTIDVAGLPLGEALDLMLKQLELSFTIRDEVLLVTTPEEFETQLVTRIYPVSDLVLAEARAAAGSSNNASGIPTKYGPPVDRLFNVVTSTIAPTSWTDVGGTGAISYVPQFRGMVVSQTLDVHNEIESLLQMLRPGGAPVARRAADAAPPASPARAVRPTPPIVRDIGPQTVQIYGTFAPSGMRRSPAEVDALAARIQTNIAPEIWRQPNGTSYVHVVDQAIVVNASSGVHRQIADLLSALNQLERAPIRSGVANANNAR